MPELQGAAALATAPSSALVRVADLRIDVPSDSGPTRTMVDDVSFELGRGQALGLVGESGSGKTLTCRALLGILPHGCVLAGGTIRFDGQSLDALDEPGWRQIRSTRVGAV